MIKTNCIRWGVQTHHTAPPVKPFKVISSTHWACPEIQTYWETIIGTLGSILGTTLPIEPKFAIMGIPSEVDIARKQLIFAALGLVVAKRDVARR